MYSLLSLLDDISLNHQHQILLRTWPDEDVLHRQHGRHRKQQVLAAEGGSLEQGPGEAWV